jgi:phosphoglycerate dehydrogenase-like enzyme
MSSLNKVVVTPPMLKQFSTAFNPLQQRGITVELNEGVYPMNDEQLADFIGESQAAIIGIDKVTGLVFKKCPGLKILSRNGVGYDNVDLEAATRHNVPVTIPIGANSVSVAELTISLIISLLRDVINRHNDLQNGIFKRIIGTEVSGKTLGIIGLGQVGRRVATRALGLEMKVIANDIDPDCAFGEKYGIPFLSFDEVLLQSDILSLHVPLSLLTKNMINSTTILRMKKGSFLINTARAPVVDPFALVEALNNHHILGAAIDVHFEELGVSAKAHEAFIGRKDIITTPHIGAYTAEALYRTTEFAVVNLIDFIEGRKPYGLVNKEIWLEK